MATKTIKTDDLDGSEANHTVSFVVKGVRYTLDLSDANMAELEKDLERWIKVAKAKAAASSTPAKPELPTIDGKPISKAAVRAWAREKGLKVGDFYVSPKVIIQYYEEMTGEKMPVVGMRPEVHVTEDGVRVVKPVNGE